MKIETGTVDTTVGMNWLADMAPAAAYQARKQFRRPDKRAAIRAARITSRAREALIRAQIEGFVVADRGGYIRKVLKHPYADLVRSAGLVQVQRIEVLEGLGTAEGLFTEKNPFRVVVYWYEADGTLIARRDSWEERETSRTDFVEMDP